MSKNKNRKWRTVLLVSFGVLLLGCGVFTALWQDAQAILYNHGLQAYVYAQTAGPDNPNNPVKTSADRAKMMQQSAKMFALSLAVYKLESKASWFQLFLFPHPDQHLAAKACFREANVLTWMGKQKEAVEAYKAYLEINPGGINDHYAGDTFADQHNLELQFNNNPALQQAQGKGQGKGKGDGDPGKQQQPGDPSNQAGHTAHTKM